MLSVCAAQLAAATSRGAGIGFDEKLFASGGELPTVETGSPRGTAITASPGKDDAPTPSIEAALETLGTINKRWG